jgi:hypothetical protein
MRGKSPPGEEAGDGAETAKDAAAARISSRTESEDMKRIFFKET